MGAFGGFTLTNKGLILQAKAQAGAALKYTRIGVGDGQLNGASLVELSRLISEKKSLGISNVSVHSQGKIVIGTVLTNQSLTTGFYFREIGVFAQDPDVGEILYCYANSGVNAEYIPAKGSEDIIEKQMNVIVVVGTASNITATIDQSLIWAKPADVAAAETRANAFTQSKITGHANDSGIHVTVGKQTAWDGAVAHINDAQKHVSSSERTAWNAKASTVAATTTVAGLMSATDKSKLDGVAAGANNYVHPSSHPASMITEDATHRFATDAEKTAWNAKASTTAATTTVAGLMSATDKSKLDGVAAGANNYVHPASHPASMITQDANNRFVTDAEKAAWNGKETTAGAQAKADTAETNAKNASILKTQRGIANGVAELDANGKIPSSQLPSYVDDVLEFASLASFPATGETGKIYIDIATNLTWRWSGSTYVIISSSLALGETSSTAYRGDRGKTAYDHSQASGNPHNTTPAQIGAETPTGAQAKVDTHANDTTKHITASERSMWNGKASTAAATASAAGLMSGADKSKLDGVAVGANNYTHPASHPPSIITQDASNRFVTDVEKASWNNKQNKITISQADPSGGVDGDIWIKY